MAQCLIALVALAEDLSLVPSTHVEFYNSSSRDLVPSSGSSGHKAGIMRDTYAPRQHTQRQFFKKSFKNKAKTNYNKDMASASLFASGPSFLFRLREKSHHVSLLILRQICQVLQALFSFHLQTRLSDGHWPLPLRHGNHRTERPACSPLPKRKLCLKRAELRAPARCFLGH